MARSGEVLERYEQLAATVAHMAALAHDRQWEHLPALDARCTALFTGLRSMPPQDLPPEDWARIVQLAGRIRSGQDALAQLVQPQFLRLAATLASRAGAP